jgi:hypothetical protein
VQEIDELSQKIVDTAVHLSNFADRNLLMTPIAIAQKGEYGSGKDKNQTKL